MDILPIIWICIMTVLCVKIPAISGTKSVPVSGKPLWICCIPNPISGTYWITENFAHFSFDYYSSEITDPATGITSLESARNAYDKAWDLIEKFREEAGNLFIYGETGVGKTYLTHCIAKELLDRSFFVLYFTSFDLFDLLSKNAFEKDSESADMAAFVYDCDLLIIDDLGTELTNSFVSSQLFCCINERIMNKKSTIISTNLTLADFMEAYSERTFSRVTSNYTMLKLVGNDIRIQKKKLLGGKMNMSPKTATPLDSLPVGAWVLSL